MKLIDGREISKQMKEDLRKQVEKLKDSGMVPGLAVVIAGSDPASQTYVRSKEKNANNLGFYSRKYELEETVSERELLDLINQLNHDDRIHGILVQLPLPEHIDEKKVINSIAVDKDVDGFHPENIGRMIIGDDSLLPCTPNGVIKMLEYEGVKIRGSHAVIIGRSNIVGKPLAMLLLQKDATVTICHSKTQNLKRITNCADILIAAVGIANFVTEDMVKKDAIVIDVGINRIEGKLVGDVDFDSVKEKVSMISPVPGGVGPMTITMLLYNTIQSAKQKGGL